MKKRNQISKEELVKSIKISSIITLIYWASIYGLYTLCTVKLYEYTHRATVKLLFILFLLAWFIALILGIAKKKSPVAQESLEEEQVPYGYKKLWRCFFAILIIAITYTYIAKTYESFTLTKKYLYSLYYKSFTSKNSSTGLNSPAPQKDSKTGTTAPSNQPKSQTSSRPGSEAVSELGNEPNSQPDNTDIEELMRMTDRIVGECFLSKLIGYRVLITDAASGSRFYSLFGTTDGGVTWHVINRDPFSQRLGCSSGVFFINDKIGFLTLGHSSNTEGQLYRTVDGGKSFKEVSLQSHSFFDFPEVPFMKDGILSFLLSQGADGDQNGGSKALYQSKDEGATWQFVREVESSELEKD